MRSSSCRRSALHLHHSLHNAPILCALDMRTALSVTIRHSGPSRSAIAVNSASALRNISFRCIQLCAILFIIALVFRHKGRLASGHSLMSIKITGRAAGISVYYIAHAAVAQFVYLCLYGITFMPHFGMGCPTLIRMLAIVSSDCCISRVHVLVSCVVSRFMVFVIQTLFRCCAFEERVTFKQTPTPLIALWVSPRRFGTKDLQTWIFVTVFHIAAPPWFLRVCP